VFSGVSGRGKVMQAKEVKKEHRENQWRNMKL
jgi:tRNA uridine 5-carbamoylmethylation protein Kti12